MVRETRHLWVGNLPDNIREDRIREHFKRYGRVQSVKLLPRSTKEETGEGTMACTVAFMDIKSASKAHNTEHKVDDRTLTTEYYEPAAIPSSASPQTTTSPYSTSPGSTRFPNGHSSSDEHGPFAERFYERNNSRVVADGEFIRRSGYHDANRSRNRDRGFRNGPYNVIMDRGSHRTLNNSWSYDSGGGSGGCAGTGVRYNSQNETGYTTTTATATAVVDGSSERRGTSDQSTKKKTKSRSGSRSPSPSGSTSSRSPSRSRSRSSSSSSSSSTSRTSSTSTPKSRRTAANSHLAHSDDRRPLAICVRNLPLRSSDTSLKDGLYHEYKKHGKVTSVKVVGQNSERHAIVCFKKPEDVEKALEVSYDKLFFGCKIDVASYQGFDVDDNDLRPYEAEIDEFHPKATRTLFIGNLEKDTTASDLRKHFDQFGEIIEIDIKNQGNVSLYAFCQYSDIVSVVKAIRKMDGEHLGNNRIKLGFGKSMPTNVVWVDGVVESVTEKYLRMQFEPFGPISKASIDRDRGQALVFYEQMVGAQSAVSKMRGYSLKGNKIQVDFASRECQQSFYEHLEKQAPVVVDRVEERRDSTSRSFDSSRFARYDTPTRPRASSYSSRSSIAASQVASAIPSPGTPGSVTPRGTSSKTRIGRFNDYYEGGDVNDRHFRSYDEYSQESAASQDDPYDPDYSYNNHESPMHVDVVETRSVPIATASEHATVPYAPPDIRNLQKERVHLLEQLEDCPSSGDEHLVSKKRLKLDLLDGTIGTDVIIEANRDHRKVMEVRRLSDVGLKHHSRRPSTDNKHSRDLIHDRSAYIPHGICKRRKTGGSDSGSRGHHYDHSGSESVGGSRPGTPLCDERPENFQPSEPRRVPRERNGPLTLPLPRFASQIPGRGSVSVAGIKGQKDVVLSSPPPAVTSPRISNPKPSSPVHVPPPASPPPRPPSLSSNSSDSENPPSPSLDERIKSLDEKYEKWSGSRALSAAGGDALAKLDATREKFRLRHKLLDFDLKEVQPSEIVKSVMAKRSVFDEDLKRLENVSEKYEPKDFTLFPRAVPLIQSSAIVVPPTTISSIKITSPSLQISSMLSPRSSGNNMIPAKGLQYPFPSHPPIQPTTPTVLQQTPPATPSSVASPTPQIQSASTTTRSANHGENRLKSCSSASSDNRLSSKVNVNRSAVLNSSTAPIKSSEKNSGNISSDTTSVAITNIETKISRTIKQSDKLTSRRDSNNGSPRGDIKLRRNSDVVSRRTEDVDKFSDASAESDRKSERGKSEERKKEQQQKEKQRLENEMLERDRLEKEQQEKERLEKERLEREKQEREKELEKERLEQERKEKERAERERLEKENQEREKREQERLKREREEQERQERLRREREEAEREMAMLAERQRKEKEEAEKKERELKEKIAEEERQARKERQAKKERHEAEKLEKERRREEDKRNKDDNHEKRKDDHKHRENHGEIKHKDNNVNADKSISNNEYKYMKQSSKEEKDKNMHEIFRKNDPHDRNNSDKYNKHSDKDSEYRRKESIKENRDNNTHEKLKEAVEIRHLSMDLDKSKSDPVKTKDNSLPANVGIKRRISSHDSYDHMSEAKKPKLHSEHKKISERRDSKDSTRSDEKVKSKLKNSRSLEEKLYPFDKSNFIKESDEKRRDKDKDRDEKHRNKQKFDKQKSKSKSREKDLRESPNSSPSKELTDKDFLATLELRSTDDLEMQKEKRSEIKEKKRYDLTDTDSEKREKDEKRAEAKRKEKASDKSRSRDDQSNRSFEDKNRSQKKERIRKPTLNSSDNTDSDEPRKHSIFDIVDDEPAYISMYDKVKARSCKNMQKQEEEKRQEKIKAKFSQLKQSRAKREEKKRSTSWDEDSDSDRERNDKNDSKNRRNKMLIISSDEDFSDFGKSHKKRGVFTDSDSDRHRQHKNELTTEASDDDIIEHKSSKSSRCINETSDDDYKNPIKSSDLYSMSKMEISSYLDLDLFKVKDEFRRSAEKERNSSKQDNSFDKSDHELTEPKAPLSEIKSEKMNNCHCYPDNSSADESTEFKKEKLRKHKKKQKRPKHSLSSEDSNKFDLTEPSQNDSSEKVKQHDKKKQHSKKEKKRDKSKDREKSKKSKRSKSTSKNDFKHDGKMENIFGSLSDSSENGMRDNETSNNKRNSSFCGGFNDENVPSRYSDSDGEKEKIIKVEENDLKDDQKVKKRKERRRKEKERLLQEAAAAAALAEAADHFNENSMDFADMGKQLEANIKDEPVNQNDTIIERNEISNQKGDIFKYYDDTLYQDFKKEDRKEVREKKKKRKKSKEERQKHHHHHHHHHHEKIKVKSEIKKETVTSPREELCTQPIHETKTQSQSLPNLLDIPSPPQEKTIPRVEIPCPVKTEPIEIEPETPSVPQQVQLPSQISPVSIKDKKRDKFIPGFGSEIDETIHENAVKSISDFDTIKTECPKLEEVKLEKPDEPPEEKPRAIISQEETEDAVAALLGESFSNEFAKHYAEEVLDNTTDDPSVTLVEEPTVQDDEEMRQAVQSLGADELEVKPETPQSEHELQIDTDTEEQDEITLRFDQQPKTPDISELIHPPKTPDIPTYYRSEESKLTPSPLVIKATPTNIGSPPSLAPITQQSSLTVNVKRNLNKIEITDKIPPLVEPTRTVISNPWTTKGDDIVPKVEPKIAVVTGVTSPQIQLSSSVSTSTSLITTSPLRTTVVKIPEPSYPPLTAISKQEITTTKADVALATIPILQVSAPALHNLPARSPLQHVSQSNSQDLPIGPTKAATSVSKIRLPIASVMVPKPLQATTINLPQPKVAFTSEPPKLIPTQEARPRMIFQNTGVPTSFPFNSTQKMLVQANIPVAGGLLVPARPGHFNYIPSPVTFNTSIAEKTNEISKPVTSPVSVSLNQNSPTKIIQMKPQSIIISPNSHISPVLNSQKIIKSLLPDNPPSLVAISSSSETSCAIVSSNNQTNVITSNEVIDKSSEVKKELIDEEVSIATPPISAATTPSAMTELEDDKNSIQPDAKTDDIQSSNEISEDSEPVEEKPEIKIEVAETKQKLAIETVTDELNQNLKKAMDSENQKQIKEEEIEVSKVLKEEVQSDPKIEDHEEIKPKIENNPVLVKEPEKVEEEKTDSESIVSDISKDCSSADMPIKDLLLDGREDKEDSDYWSPKDVNIDSVIKTLCSADELSNHSNDNMSTKEDHPKEEQILLSQKEKSEVEINIKETVENKELDNNKSDAEIMEDFVEDDDREVLSKIATRRGGRGRGRKARGGIERGTIQTRRAKTLTKEAPTPTKRVNNARGGRAKFERKVTKSESEAPTDIYEFREDEENRPRLILTIKQSNTNSAAIQSAVVKEVAKETLSTLPPPKTIEVKEKTEDFTQPAGSTNTRKSKRLQEKDIFRTTVDDTIEDVVRNVVTRSSTVVTRRSTRLPAPIVKATPETQRKSIRGRRIGRRASEATEDISEEKDKSKSSEEVVANTSLEAPKIDIEKPKEVTPQVNATVIEKDENKQPQVPVKESIVEKPPIGLKAAVLRRIKGEMGQEPMTLIDPVTGLLTPMRECEENKYIPVPGENKAPIIAPSSQQNIIVSSAEVKPIQQTVITSSQQATPVSTFKQHSKPQSLKAHVLASQAAQAVVTQQLAHSQKQNAVIVSSAPQTSISMENKIHMQQSQNLSVNVSIPNCVPAHASPRTSLTLTSNSPKPVTVKQPVSSPSQMYNLISQQMMHMAKTSPSTPSIITQQQSIIKQVPLPKVPMLPKTSHPMHIPAGVPSSVLGKIPSQTMVTNVGRLMQGKNMMEPPKVDVSLSNLMSVRGLSSLSPQGQARHHSQAGMPGYEASLHGERGLYNRSRSPPPAHQNSPSPQAETIPHFPPGSVSLRPHDLPPPHYMNPSHVMYQQYLRQSYHFPRSSIVSGGIEKPGDGQEGEEAPVTSPPLELRISNSVGLSLSSRSAAVPHSLHSPHDRATDSPQIGQVYNMPTARMQHYNLNRYYEPAAEPPPAHRPVTSHSSVAALGSDRPPLSHMAGLGAPDRPLVPHLPPDRPLGPHLAPDRPLGSHLPPDRPLSGHSALMGHLPLGNPERPSSSHLPPDRPMSSHLTPDRLSGISTPDRPVSAHTMSLCASLGGSGNFIGAVARHIGATPTYHTALAELLKNHKQMWQGLLALKNDQAAVQMYFLSGNDHIAKCSLPTNTDGSTPPLRIFQRMRLEPPQVEGVTRKMQIEKEHAILMALPCGKDPDDVITQNTNLANGLINYLHQKQAAGIVNVAAPGTTQPPAFVVHIFPKRCSFVETNLGRIAPRLLEGFKELSYLLIVITTV